MKNNGLLCALVLIVLSAGGYCSGTWQLETNMPIARDQFAGAVSGGWLYVFGGNGNPDGINLASGQRYNLSTQVWETIADNPHIDNGIGVEEICGVGLNGLFYVFGAWPGDGTLNFNEVYNPATDTWTSLAPKPTEVSSAIPAVYDGQIYLFGGYYKDDTMQDGVIRTQVEVYDPLMNTWAYVTDIPKTLDSMAVAIYNGSAYLIGGYEETDAVMTLNTEVMAYDIISDTWTRDYDTMAADDARAFSWSATPVLDGKAYLTGGSQGNLATNKVTIYDIASKSWQAGPALPEVRNSHVVACDGGTIFVAGGYADSEDLNRAKKTVYRWAPHKVNPDLTGDGRIDLADLAVMAEYWLVTLAADNYTGTYVTDLPDFSGFLRIDQTGSDAAMHLGSDGPYAGNVSGYVMDIVLNDANNTGTMVLTFSNDSTSFTGTYNLDGESGTFSGMKIDVIE